MTELKPRAPHPDPWPSLPLAAWKDTYATPHRRTQTAGKVRLRQSPMLNHWWQVALYLTARGLTTSPIPYGERSFGIEFDFRTHRLRIETADGNARVLALAPRSVADFYREFMARLRELGLEVKIWPVPVELPGVIPFAEDRVHASYDAEYAHRCWRVLLQADRVLKEFRSRFLGKASPVHFFWGSFDLAATRFSGRRAPELSSGGPNVAAWVMQEAYSHEVRSAGFWPGDDRFPEPAFYAYAYPEPEGFAAHPVRPEPAFYHRELHEFLLPYEAVRTARSPDRMLLDFFQTTYEAAADLGRWDRAALERGPLGPAQRGRGV